MTTPPPEPDVAAPERQPHHRRRVVVHPDAGTLAEAVAARLLTRLLDVQSLHSPVHVGLTGGTVGIEALRAVARSPIRDVVDWSGVHLWWGDERFLPSGDPERNETQAREALLDSLADVLPAGNVHPMPALGDGTETPEQAAEAYAAELASFAADDAPAPELDVILLGMGPDGHVASLFPGHEALAVTGTPVVGVHGSPKPPPERVSLTFEAINAAHQVWFVVAGAEKSAQLAAALGGADPTSTPAAGAYGRERTLWLVDAAAAADVGS